MAEIAFTNVTFRNSSNDVVLRDVSMTLPADQRCAVLCRDPRERSALVQLISGQASPNSGRISGPKIVSFPVGAVDVLNVRFSASQNTEFLSRLYGLSRPDMLRGATELSGVDLTTDASLSKLGKMEMLNALYSLSYAVPFELYVADTMALPPAPALRAAPALQKHVQRINDFGAGLLLFTSAPPHAIAAAETGAIFSDGKLVRYATVMEAVRGFKEATAKSDEEKKQAQANRDNSTSAPLLFH